jgi:hypothetical protein
MWDSPDWEVRSAVLGMAVGNTKALVARWILTDPAEFSASREGMLAFGSRHVYSSPLGVVVRSSGVG